MCEKGRECLMTRIRILVGVGLFWLAMKTRVNRIYREYKECIGQVFAYSLMYLPIQ
jgi:hypothetical protein